MGCKPYAFLDSYTPYTLKGKKKEEEEKKSAWGVCTGNARKGCKSVQNACDFMKRSQRYNPLTPSPLRPLAWLKGRKWA